VSPSREAAALIATGIERWAAGDIDGAAELWSKAARLAPDDVRARAYAQYAAWRRGVLDQEDDDRQQTGVHRVPARPALSDEETTGVQHRPYRASDEETTNVLPTPVPPPRRLERKVRKKQ
jgi:hypothetical protein